MIHFDPARVATRALAFVGAAGVTGLLLAWQVGIARGAIVASTYLAMTFAPFGLIDALLVPSPRSRLTRLARIAFLFLLLSVLSVAWQWRALAAVPYDLQVQIGVESLMRNVAFLGAYLLLEALLGLMVRRRLPA